MGYVGLKNLLSAYGDNESSSSRINFARFAPSTHALQTRLIFVDGTGFDQFVATFGVEAEGAYDAPMACR